ncbi:MAG: hypothetical protein R2764_07590 [Bacteroidales bacterium]
MRSDIIKYFSFTGIFLLAILWSCTDDPDIPNFTGTDYSDGVFVINEGSFGSSSGTLTLSKRD